jgi:spermidine synthase
VDAPDTHHEPIVVDRCRGLGGELVLRRSGGHYEIISNGVFLMDTRNGESERLLISATLERLPDSARVLIGGLGVGFSVAEAVRFPGVMVTVVELEPTIVRWHRTHLRSRSAGALDDPRVRVVCADLLSWLHGAAQIYDAICLDIDNGPDWTVTDGNAALYDEAGLRLLTGHLAPGGGLAVWSAHSSPAFEARLRTRFAAVEVRTVPVPRGGPDVVYLASTGS